MAMLGNLVAMLENVVTTLGRKMTMMETLFADLGWSTNSLGLIGQHTLRNHNKFILCPKNKIPIAYFIYFSHCLCIEKNQILFANGNKSNHLFCLL